MSDAATIKIGGFQVVDELPGGEGGQGVIYIARCVEKQYDGVDIGDQVAIKVMTVQDNDGKLFQKLNTRTTALSALHHPGILKYYGCLSKKEVFNYYHFVIMEYLHGKTLKQKIAELRSGVDGDEAMRVIRCCLEALSYAESKNIIHRDLTPSNIFLCDNGDVKLIDFEVAKTTRPTEQTNSTGIFGKLDYMAPELFLGSKETPVQSDIFSFCLCIHEAFTGNLPYERGSVAQAKGEIKIDEKLRSLVVGLDEVLAKGLAVNPTERYASFHDLSEAFKPLKLTTWTGTEGRTYQALQFVGGGGFGWVYKAAMMPGMQRVAVKYLLDVRFTDRFEREAETLKRFDDDRIVQFIDYFTEAKILGGHGFLVMNFLDDMPGSSLRDRLKKIKATTGKRTGVPYEEVLVAFIRLAEGLALMHQATVYHRDVKPSNLYFPEGKPHLACIMDLGVARNEEATLTHMGHVPGTLDYMPPEFGRSEGGRGSAASDIYAFGLCLHEALTGRFPLPRLPAGSQAWVAYLSRSVSNPPLPEFKDEIILSNPMLKALLERMIEPDVSKRLSDMAEVVETLKRLLEETPGKGCSYPPSKPVRGLKPKAAKTTAAPVPDQYEGEEGATEKTLVVDEATLATLAAGPEELERLKASVRADAQARQQPPPEPVAPVSKPSLKPVASLKKGFPFFKSVLLKRHGKALVIGAAVVLFLGGSFFLFRKPLGRLIGNPMASMRMKRDTLFLEQLLSDVDKQREQMKKDLESIETPEGYKAFGDKVAELHKQLIDGARQHMTVGESKATPELVVQYYAFAEKTNQVGHLSRLALAAVESKALKLCEQVESVCNAGDLKEAQRLEALWNEWKTLLPQATSGLQGARIRSAKNEAEQKIAKRAEMSARKKTEMEKAEANRKVEEERLRLAEAAKAEAERLRGEREGKAMVSDRQRADLSKCDELRNEAINAYMQGDLARGDKSREAWEQTIKGVKELISEQLSQNQSDELTKAREDAVAKARKSEEAKMSAVMNESGQLLAKIEVLYGPGTPEALVAGDAEHKKWQNFVAEKKFDTAQVEAGEKRVEQARVACKGKVSAGLLQKALTTYKAGQLSQGDAIVSDVQKLGALTPEEQSQLTAARAACEEQLKQTVDWGTVLKSTEEEARGALTSQELEFVNSQVTQLAEVIAKAKAAGIPVVEATQTLQKLNMHRVMLASPVRVALSNPIRGVVAEFQNEAKQWQPVARSTRVSPGKVLFRFIRRGYKTIMQEIEVLPGKNLRVQVPKTWEAEEGVPQKR